MKRKILSIILSIMMLVAFMPVMTFTAFAADSDVTYKLVNSMKDGNEYIIVDSNSANSNSHAIKFDGSNKKVASQGVKVTSSGSEKIVTVSASVSSDIAMIALSSDTLGHKDGNNTYPLIRSSNNLQFGTTSASAGEISVSSSKVRIKGNTTTYYIRYKDGWTTDTSSSKGNAYLYEKVTSGGGQQDQYAENIALTTEDNETTKNRATCNIDAGQTINVTLTNGSGYSKTYDIASTDSNVATVSKITTGSMNSKGTTTFTITGVSKGTAYVNVTLDNDTRNAQITVNVNGGTGGGTGGGDTGDDTHESDGNTYIGFTSDVHGKTSTLEDWFTHLPRTMKLENMGYCGDYSYDYNDQYLTHFNTIVSLTNTYVGPNKGVYTTGNHCWSNGGTSVVDKMKETTGFYVLGEAANVTTSDYEVYCFGAYKNSYDAFQVSDITAMDNYLKTVNKNTPVFILSHYPLHYISSRTIENAERAIEVLNKYPNAVFMWGHNHSQGGESHYGEVKSFGDSIQYTSSKSANNINFTYACAGAGNNSQGNYDGCVAKVNGTEVTYYYYDSTGTKGTIKGRNGDLTVDISDGSSQTGGGGSDSQPTTGITYEKVNKNNLEDGEYIVVADNSSDGLVALQHNLKGLQVTDNSSKIVVDSDSDLVWDAVFTSGTDKVTLKNGSNYLCVNSSKNLEVGNSSSNSTWNLNSEGKMYLTISNNNYALNYSGSSSSSSVAGFNVKSNSTSEESFTFYKKVSGAESNPDDPTPTGSVVEITPSTSNPTTSKTIAVGESFTLRITNGSSNSQKYSFKLSQSDDAVATLGTTQTASINAGETVDVRIEGKGAGTSNILVTNGNTSSERKATINLTVTGEGGGGDTPDAPDTDTVYKLTNSIKANGEYLVVSGNSTGSAYAVKNAGGSSDGTDMGKSSVSVKSGDVDNDGSADTYIEDADSNLIWKATTNSDGFDLKNGSDYLEGKSGNVKVYSSQQYPARYWTYSGSQLQHKGGEYTYSVYYDSSSNAFSAKSEKKGSESTTNKVYIYEKTNIEGGGDTPDTPEKTSFTVTFNTNGGSDVDQQEVENGSKATRPANNPTKVNCEFVDWYSDSGLSTVFDFDTPITANITLYAKWNPAGEDEPEPSDWQTLKDKGLDEIDAFLEEYTSYKSDSRIGGIYSQLLVADNYKTVKTLIDTFESKYLLPISKAATIAELDKTLASVPEGNTKNAVKALKDEVNEAKTFEAYDKIISKLDNQKTLAKAKVYARSNVIIGEQLVELIEAIKACENPEALEDLKAQYASVFSTHEVDTVTVGNKTYNGKYQTGAVTVKDTYGNVLKSGTDYTVSGSRASVGKYTVTVKMSSQYADKTYKLTGKIIPKNTTFKLKKAKKAFTVKVAKKSKTYVTGYQMMYSTSKTTLSKNKGTIKTISKSYKKTSKKFKAKKKKTYYVKVRTYKTVSGVKYYSSWSGVKSVKTK